MTDSSKRIMIVAGEASGDQYGAGIVREMKQLAPSTTFIGIGGSRMREEGVTTLFDAGEMAVVGLIEVIRHFRVISRAFTALTRILSNDPPSLLILIDYPGFNLRLAARAKKAGVRVLYFVSPQIWAWKAGRIKKIARVVDHMAVLFPFEVPYYEKAGVQVSFVGHPMLDIARPTLCCEEAFRHFGLDPTRRTIGLFPGSRRIELGRMLPVLLDAADILQSRYPDIQFVIPRASTLKNEDMSLYLKKASVQPVVTTDRLHDLIGICDAVATVSGTVSLEIALAGVPMTIIYKLSSLTYQLAKRLVKIDHIGICNIIAGKTIVRELIQDAASPLNIADELSRILNDAEYACQMRRSLLMIRESLGAGGAAFKVAQLACDMSEG